MRFLRPLAVALLFSMTTFGVAGCGPSYMSEEEAMEQEASKVNDDEIDDGGNLDSPDG